MPPQSAESFTGDRPGANRYFLSPDEFPYHTRLFNPAFVLLTNVFRHVANAVNVESSTSTNGSLPNFCTQKARPQSSMSQVFRLSGAARPVPSDTRSWLPQASCPKNPCQHCPGHRPGGPAFQAATARLVFRSLLVLALPSQPWLPCPREVEKNVAGRWTHSCMRKAGPMPDGVKVRELGGMGNARRKHPPTPILVFAVPAWCHYRLRSCSISLVKTLHAGKAKK